MVLYVREAQAQALAPRAGNVEMHVQVISASSCEIYSTSKIRNRLEPSTTEKLLYVYSNSKLVAATRDSDASANELKM